MFGVKAATKAARLATYAARSALGPAAEPCIAPLPNDTRFAHPGWDVPPFSLHAQAFLLTQQWWHVATHSVRGVAHHLEQVVSFVVRQLLDLVSPPELDHHHSRNPRTHLGRRRAHFLARPAARG